MTSAAAVAGNLFLQQSVVAQENPAAQVVDRAADLKIKSLRAFPCGPKVYVKIETNHGITGWGEIDQLQPQVAALLAESLFELLDGENPTRIEYLWQKLYRSHRDMRGGPFMVHTIAGIDMALWDIAGKVWGVPVYRLLGGPVRDKMRIYPSPSATKAGAGPAECSGNPNEIEGYVRQIEHARASVGPEGIVIFDAHCALPPPFLIQLAGALEPYDIMFIEEVAVPGNISVFRRLKEAITIPLATGERDRTIWEFIPYLEHRCLDVLQPDCAHTGGITQMIKIATLAEAFQTPIAPHAVTSDLGMAASFHASFAIPLFIIHEYYQNMMPREMIAKSWTVDEAGYVSLPQGPGLGVEVNEAAIVDYAKNNKQEWRWPTRGVLKDGSISDY